MFFLQRGFAIAAIGLGALAMSVPGADAGNRYHYGNNSGVYFGVGVVSGLIAGGIISQNRGYYGPYNCYGAYCRNPYLYNQRGYYPRPYYGPTIYPRYYGYRPYYRPIPRVSYSRAHYDYCFNRYRSYRAYDNTFQPYHGPRRLCRSPYY